MRLCQNHPFVLLVPALAGECEAEKNSTTASSMFSTLSLVTFSLIRA
jgi:hypothetical protein